MLTSSQEVGEGLPVVHFSAQPEPFLSLVGATHYRATYPIGIARVVPKKWSSAGPTLVHFTAQFQTFLSQESPNVELNILWNVLTSSREVDECKPPAGGSDAVVCVGGRALQPFPFQAQREHLRGESERDSERRSREYKEAPGFRSGPLVHLRGSTASDFTDNKVVFGEMFRELRPSPVHTNSSS